MATAASPKTILVMDDSEIVLGTVKAVLEDSGFAVCTAANLAQFEAHLAATRPDAVVLDVRMPEIYGDDVGAILREVRKTNAPILLFSSLDDSVLAARAAEAKLDGYVSKNAGVGALLAHLVSMFAQGAP
jgi:DNA-binding response OmpR family regulator